jgi:hypothetical protein
MAPQRRNEQHDAEKAVIVKRDEQHRLLPAVRVARVGFLIRLGLGVALRCGSACAPRRLDGGGS